MSSSIIPPRVARTAAECDDRPVHSSSVLDHRLGKCDPEGLEITPSLLYFGAMVQGEDSLLPFVFRVTNTGDAAIEIRDIKITLGSEYFSLTSLNYPDTVPGKDYFDVEVECNPAQIPGIFIGVLEIETNEARQNYTIGMSGRVLASATITNISNDITRNITNNISRYLDDELDKTNQYVKNEIIATKGDYTALVRDERWARINGDEAEAGYRLTVEANLRNEIVARVTDEKIARVNSVEAEARSRELVEARLRNEATATAETLTRAYVNADLAEASQRVDLAAALRGETDQKVSAGITAERAVRVTAEEQIARSVETLRADIQTGSGDATAYINSKISDERVVTTNAIEASATATRGLFANYLTTDQVTGAIRTSAAAEVVAREQSIATAVGAEATRINNVVASFSSGAGNLLTNTDFVTTDGWDVTYNGVGAVFGINLAGDLWQPIGENTLTFYQPHGTNGGGYCEAISSRFAVMPGSYIQFFIFVAAHRCNAWVSIHFFDSNGSYINYAGEYPGIIQDNGGRNPGAYERIGSPSYPVPINAVTAEMVIRKSDTYSNQPNSYSWYWRPYVSEAKLGQTSWNSYSVGSAKAGLIKANARIDSEASARSSAIGAEAIRTDTLVASVRSDILSGDTAGRTYADSKISDEAYVRSTQDTALAGRSDYIQSQLDGVNDSVLNARIYNESVARTNAMGAESTRVNGLFANYATVGSLNAAISAEVTQRDQAIASVSGSLAQSINEVRGTANGAFGTAGTALSVAQGADGKANSALARWALQLDVNGYVSGIEANNNGSTAALTFNSDLIQFRKPGGGAGLNMSGGELWATDPQGNKRARFGYWG